MNSNEQSKEDLVEFIDADEENSSVDDFIKQLEEREKDLHISSELVIEVGESDVEHENIHDTFSTNLQNPNNPKDAPQNQSVELYAENMQTASVVPELNNKISKLEAECEELKKSMQRRQKDFDNYRQRIERERAETFKNILAGLATQMLPVLDNLDRALDSTSAAEGESQEKDFQRFLEGIVLVNQQLNEVLVGMGVEPIPAVGEAFNPNFHEAVATEESDAHPHKTVIEELLRGYKIENKIIRASMVKVSSSKKDQPPSAELELD